MTALAATRVPFEDPATYEFQHTEISSHPLTSQSEAFNEIRPDNNFDQNDRPYHMEVSFYHDPAHLLDIRTVDTRNLLLAKALTILMPLSEAYAITNYDEAFNWPAVFAYLKKLSDDAGFTWTNHQFYVVEFRSKLQENIDRELLFKLDKESHREATESGGLLKYWYGSPDAHRRNLATCLWRSKEDAIRGGKGVWHKQARNVISKMYEEINVKGLTLHIEDGVKGWSFTPFSFH